MNDVPAAHKFKAQLAKSKAEYASLDRDALDKKYLDIITFLLRKEWSERKNSAGKMLAVDGSVFNQDQYSLADEKMKLVELEFRKRYPMTFDVQLDFLIATAREQLAKA